MVRGSSSTQSPINICVLLEIVKQVHEYLPRELSPRVDNSEEFLINAGELYSSIVTTVKKSRDLDRMRGQKIVKLTKNIYEGNKH